MLTTCFSIFPLTVILWTGLFSCVSFSSFVDTNWSAWSTCECSTTAASTAVCEISNATIRWRNKKCTASTGNDVCDQHFEVEKCNTECLGKSSFNVVFML